MLHLLLGRAGSGKTTTILDTLCQQVEEGQQAVLVVPEQFSFECERALTRRLGLAKMMGVEVLSFTRLADWVFRRHGGLAGRSLDPTTRLILMSVALDQVKDTLETYRRQSRSAAFLPALVSLTTEFKNAGAAPEDLQRVAMTTPDKRLSAKLGELAVIYGAFQALVDRGFTDPLDDLGRAARLAAEHHAFAQTAVFVDSFLSFTAAENRMLAAILADSPLVWVSLCADQLPQEGGAPIFATARQTARRLKEIARRAGTKVAKPLVLEAPRRFAAGDLAAIEGFLAQQELEAPPDPNPAHGVTLVAARDPYEEMEYVAAQICRLVREEGLRYREILVVGRALESRKTAVSTVFGRYGIPYFDDRRVCVTTQPLASLLMGALEAVRGGWDTGELLRLAKNPLTGVDLDGAALLENYCFTWNVGGSQWLAPFQNSPGGFSDRVSEDEKDILAQVNLAREQLTGPLAQLKDRLSGCDGRGFALALWQYLEALETPERLRQFAATLDQEEGRQLLELSEGLWASLTGILDVFATQLEGGRQTLAHLADLFAMAVSSIELGQIPRTADQVMVGDADRIRPSGPRAVFVVGANEGEFPQKAPAGGIFRDSEREILMKAGLELASAGIQRTLEERYFFYTALCAPSRWLYVSFCRGDAQGARLEPALALTRMAEKLRLDIAEARDLDRTLRAATWETALDQAAAAMAQPDSWSAALEQCLEATDHLGLSRLRRAAKGFAVEGLAPPVARALFGQRIYASPSRVEKFFECPFTYFCKFGLGVEPRKKAEFSPLESGIVIHMVLEKILAKYGGEALSQLDQRALEEEISALIAQFLGTRVEDLSALPARTRYQFARLVAILTRLLRRLGAEFAQSAFVPAGFEVRVGGEEIPPMTVVSPGGIAVTLEGTIDRVDLMDVEDGSGNRFVRVVDYKSGARKFSLSQVVEGLNMQLLLYLFAVCDGGEGRFSALEPAGVLYMPARAEVVTAARSDTPAQIEAAHGAGLRMNGLLLDDRQALEGMEHHLSGQYIPVKLTAGGLYDKRSPVVDRHQLEQLRRHVRRMVGEMGDRLSFGKIAPSPAVGGDRSPCDHCDYAAICQSTGGATERAITSLTAEEFFEELTKREEESHGGTVD